MEFIDRLNQSVEYIKNNTNYRPKIGIILGSGLGEFGDSLENSQYFEYKDIPNMPVSTVEGHKGRFVITEKLICMQGRFHFYEGYKMEDVTFPIRLMKILGVDTIIVTNAAGGVNLNLEAGDLMIITDHINMMGTSPLIGKNLDTFGERFPDMSNCYDREYIRLCKEVAMEKGIGVKEGVYCAMTGPNYETPAEIKMIRAIGGDSVGMSTVPEVIVANHSKMKVIGISCITNMAAGVSDCALNHQEVIDTSQKVKTQFITLLRGIVEKI